jgi:hypothetical protein
MATPIEFEGTGRKDLNFKFGDVNLDGSADFFSKTTLDQFDIALDYGIPLLETATLDKLNIDLGVNVRIIDFETEVTQESVVQSRNFFLVICTEPGVVCEGCI